MRNVALTGCKGCGRLEPETVLAVSKMTDIPSATQIEYYNQLIKAVKRSENICLQSMSLHHKFTSFYIRAAHSKEAALIDWTKNEFDSTEVGTIRFVANKGVGGSTTGGNSYINNNYSQQDDKFSPDSKFGAYVTADFNNRILGFQTSAGGAGAAQMTLSKDMGDRIYDSWGANPQQYFNTAGAGMREIVRGGTYDNNGTEGGRTKLYQAEIDMTGGVPNTVRNDFDINFYSLASNSSNLGTPNGTPVGVNTEGLMLFEFSGSYLINSRKLGIAVTKYLTQIGALEEVEPEPSETFNIIHSHNFENNTLGSYGSTAKDADWDITYDNKPNYPTIVDFQGSRRGRNTHQQGQFGPSAGGDFGGSLPSISNEVYISYSMYFENGFDWGIAVKFPGLRMHPTMGAGNGGGSSTGGSTIRFQSNSQGKLRWYVYHHQMTAPYGESLGWDGYQLSPNLWYRITIRVVLNTPGVANGILQAFVNDVLVNTQTGMLFRTNSSVQNINMQSISTFMGGDNSSYAPDHTQYSWMDNFFVWKYSDEYLTANPTVARGFQSHPNGHTLIRPFNSG